MWWVVVVASGAVDEFLAGVVVMGEVDLEFDDQNWEKSDCGHLVTVNFNSSPLERMTCSFLLSTRSSAKTKCNYSKCNLEPTALGFRCLDCCGKRLP